MVLVVIKRDDDLFLKNLPGISWVRALCDAFCCSHMGNQALREDFGRCLSRVGKVKGKGEGRGRGRGMEGEGGKTIRVLLLPKQRKS